LLYAKKKEENKKGVVSAYGYICKNAMDLIPKS
jgi:hypothetical protein